MGGTQGRQVGRGEQLPDRAGPTSQKLADSRDGPQHQQQRRWRQRSPARRSWGSRRAEYLGVWAAGAGAWAQAGVPLCAGASPFPGAPALSVGVAAAARTGSHRAPPRASGPTTNSEGGARGVPDPPDSFTPQLCTPFHTPVGPFPNVASDLRPGAPPAQTAGIAAQNLLGRMIWLKNHLLPLIRPSRGAVPRSWALSPPSPLRRPHASHMVHCLMESPSQPCAQPAPRPCSQASAAAPLSPPISC